MKFRTGIIGLGVVSNVHRNAIALSDQAELLAVCDSNPEKYRQCKDLVHIPYYQNYEEMLDREKLDVVHICLPHYLHYEAAKACAVRGIHVLCEKPSTMNSSQLGMMKQLEQDYTFRLGICLQNRWNATFQKMKELIGTGEYGRLTGVKALAVWSRPKSYYEASPWRGIMAQAGGGLMINQAIHTLDQMQLLGGKIKSVKGQICNLLDYGIEVEDTATANVTFENGVRGVFFGTLAHVKNSSIELQAVCEKGCFTIKDYGLWYALTEADNEKSLILKDQRLSGAQSYYGASHCLLIDDFYRTLSGEKDSYVSIHEEGVVIRLIEAIRKSSIEGKEIIWEEED